MQNERHMHNIRETKKEGGRSVISAPHEDPSSHLFHSGIWRTLCAAHFLKFFSFPSAVTETGIASNPGGTAFRPGSVTWCRLGEGISFYNEDAKNDSAGFVKCCVRRKSDDALFRNAYPKTKAPP